MVFLDEFKNRMASPWASSSRRATAVSYTTTTDIACAKYRYETLGADRVMYFIDSRQHQHLMQA